MIHVEKPSFYEEVKNYLDSLRTDGYVIFWEGIITPSPVDSLLLASVRQDRLREALTLTIDSLTQDTIDRKFRKIFGMHLTSYRDTGNQSVPQRYKRKRELIDQTAQNTGIDFNKDIWADLSKAELIEIYEREIKKIELTEYDFQTGLFEKYSSKRKELKGHSRFALLHTFREAHVEKMIRESSHKKIVLLFGKGHWRLLYGGLVGNPGGYEEIKNAEK